MQKNHLHSSMVRLEIYINVFLLYSSAVFTFQYGQIRNVCLIIIHFVHFLIYIPVWLDQKSIPAYAIMLQPVIYIPVWLDQKYDRQNRNREQIQHLHSSMVRLEIRNKTKLTINTFVIYIPVWLDQKYILLIYLIKKYLYLHSSMVRLEIVFFRTEGSLSEEFTFQYGQIRNRALSLRFCIFEYYLHSSMVRLEIKRLCQFFEYLSKFTFQYGQIRNTA